MKTLTASLMAFGLLLESACAPAIPTQTGSPAPSASGLLPAATASAAVRPSPSAAPTFALNPPSQYLDANTMFVSSEADLARSDDAGARWTVMDAPRVARFVELRMIDREHGWSILFFRRDPPL